MSRRPAALLVLLAVLLLPAACSRWCWTPRWSPASEGDEGTPANGVVLMAQSVPTASWVPCLDVIPLGWHVSGMEATDEDARIWLDSNRDGVRASRSGSTSAATPRAPRGSPATARGWSGGSASSR